MLSSAIILYAPLCYANDYDDKRFEIIIKIHLVRGYE